MPNRYRWRDPAQPAEPGLATADPAESAIDLADGAERYADRPAQRAQDLIWEAWEATGAHRTALARRGPDAQAGALLTQARELNPHIPAYLTHRKKLPRQHPAYTVLGEESEAVDYAAGASALWASVPGALTWLER